MEAFSGSQADLEGAAENLFSSPPCSIQAIQARPEHLDIVISPSRGLPVDMHHRNLLNLNLHAWLLAPQLSKNKASLRQWQNELRLLKESQPDQFMRQSGPFLQNGATVIRWTSGHHLSKP